MCLSTPLASMRRPLSVCKVFSHSLQGPGTYLLLSMSLLDTNPFPSLSCVLCLKPLHLPGVYAYFALLLNLDVVDYFWRWPWKLLLPHVGWGIKREQGTLEFKTRDSSSEGQGHQTIAYLYLLFPQENQKFSIFIKPLDPLENIPSVLVLIWGKNMVS